MASRDCEKCGTRTRAPGCQRSGKPWKTCCRGCAINGRHDTACDARQQPQQPPPPQQEQEQQQPLPHQPPSRKRRRDEDGMLRLPRGRGQGDVTERWGRHGAGADQGNSGKWVTNISLSKGADIIFERVVAAGRTGRLGHFLKARTDIHEGGTLAIIMVYVPNFRNADDVQRVASELAALGVDGGPYNFKPDCFTLEGRYGVRAARGIQGSSDFPTGIWRFKALSGHVIGFERVEPSLKAGPSFWADYGGKAEVKSSMGSPIMVAVKPGSRMSVCDK